MKKNLYIQMFSIHGLVRAENMEMGRDADTGGQIKYVVEMGKALAANSNIARVDLFTRYIEDKTVSDDYAREIEDVTDKFRIIRIRCGGKKYFRKELLWPHLDEYVDKTIKFIKREKAIPDIVHGHYADGGYVAMMLSEIFGSTFIFTGHSLGRAKLQKLINDGMKYDDIVKRYKIDRRIAVEEDIMKQAAMVVTSTTQEVDEQYGMYENGKLPAFRVIPPGLDIEKFYPYYQDMGPDQNKDELEMHAYASVSEGMNRFLKFPDRPLILTLCRPDKRKNISGLIKAYGEDLELQSMANLAIFAGIRKDIEEKEENERDVLTDMLLLMDKYDLYGLMAIPKKHDFEYEVPELYRIAAEKRGVFVNAALTEPFGLTIIEASACGLPVVATNDGGPNDIIRNCKNGILIDPTDSSEIRKAIKKIIVDNEKWKTFSKNGIVNTRKHYTWDSHVKKYYSELKNIAIKKDDMTLSDTMSKQPIGKRLSSLDYLFITDIDNTLIGDDNSRLKDLIDFLQANREKIGFGVATGRTVDSAVDILKKHKVPDPDIIISSVGSEIYYGSSHTYEQGWDTHLSYKWNREKIKELLDGFDYLAYQEEDTQRKYKVSYDMEHHRDRLTEIHDILVKNRCGYNLIYSHGQFLDVLPHRASKGRAIRYISYKWEIPLENIIVSGDSGNDEEMMRGEPMAIVVGNYSDELEKVKGLRKVYFAQAPCAGGILEGFHHYQLQEKL